MIQTSRAGRFAVGLLILAAIPAFTRADERLKGIACRSVHLGYPAPEGTAFYNEVTIRKSAVGSYFMVCGWNTGYFGLQELGNGKKLLIFSVWDSQQNNPNAVKDDLRTKLLYKDDKVRVGRFGGEGTGGQSFFDYDWKIDETYRLMVTSRVAGERTEYTGWFFVPETKTWTRLITFSTVTGGKNLGGYYAFIEDFKRDRVSTTHVRLADFANGWVKTTRGEAVPLTKARFTADSNPVLNIDAHAEKSHFTLATGGDTENTGAKLREVMTLPEPGEPTPPEALSLAAAEPIESADLLRGPWTEGDVHRESVLFVKGAEGAAAAKLLYDAERLLEVRSADGRSVFEAGRDFRPTADGSGLELTTESRIPFLEESALFPPKDAPRSIAHKMGDPETNVLFDNEHWFHDQQVEVSYVPRNPRWDAHVPTFAGDRLPRVAARLKNKEPLTIVVTGDSISNGFNASEFTNTAPHSPPYPKLVAGQLERTSGSKVELHNLAVNGWSSAQGAADFAKAARLNPDLVIIAFGMNDVGQRDPEGYKANIKSMLDQLHEAKPDAEVILVATMTGNPDWRATPAEMFPVYRDALKSLEGPGVAVADLTAIWQRLLERKRFVDLTGNGVNHPNDYGHRVYAQALLSLLVDPAAAALKTP